MITEVAPRKVAYFCGVLPSGNAQAILQIVMGKLYAEAYAAQTPEEASIFLASRAGLGKPVVLDEPVIFHRVMAMTSNREMVITHQMVDDRFWPKYRGASMPFLMSHFLSLRVMDPEQKSERSEIDAYEKLLLQQHAQAGSGITLAR